MEWLEIIVHTPSAGVESIAEIFRELEVGGVVIEDPAVIFEYAAKTSPEEWALPPCLHPDGTALVKSYFPVENGLEKRVEMLEEAVGNLDLVPPPEIVTRTIAGEDWANAWRAFYKPFRVGHRLVIKPAWEEFSAAAGEIVIDMDPGMAFGCGTHETTSLCLRLLEKYIIPGSLVYDIGTGSGILAVASAKLGAAGVMAVDVDPVACRVAAENANRNKVSESVQIIRGDKFLNLSGKAGLIVSNIIADAIIELIPQAEEHLLPGGIFIASGIILQRAAEVSAAVAAAGLTLCERLVEGEWVALAARKE